MSYFTRTDIEAEIPPTSKGLIALLDDDHDGAEDTGLYTSLASRAEARVDAILARRYTVPFSTVPVMVKEAAILSFCAGLYRRRGVKDTENPFAEREQSALEFLKDVASGAADLDASLSHGPVGSIEGEDNEATDDLHWAMGNQEGL